MKLEKFQLDSGMVFATEVTSIQTSEAQDLGLG